MSALSSLFLGYRKAANQPNPCCTFAILCLALLSAPAHAQAPKTPKQLHVAAASDLHTVLPILADDYEKATGTKLILSFASSSALATQIINGGPFDIFLAADFSFPQRIVSAGLADTTNPVLYARGTLVLWARKDSPIQPLTINSLSDPKLQHIAIADETRAPYGIAAVRTLSSMRLLDKLQPKLVRADNVEQAGQFAESGNAQIAFISLSEATSQHMKDVGTYNLAPFVYPPINQSAVVMKNSPNAAEAHTFLTWLLSKPTQEKLRTYGYTPAF